MTESLKTLVVKDRRVDFDLDKSLVAMTGGNQFNTQVLTFQNTALGGTVNQSFSVPNSQGLSRKAYLRMQGTIGATAAVGTGAPATAGSIVQPGAFGLSSNPIYNVITSINLTVGSCTTTWSNVNTTIDIVSRIKRNCYTDYTLYSSSSVLPDNAVYFSDWYGTNKSVLAPYGSIGGTGEIQSPRSSRVALTTNPLYSSPGAIVAQFDVSVPFIMGPFTANNDDKTCIARPGNFSVQITLDSDSSKLASWDQTRVALTAFTSSITNFALYFSTIDLTAEMPIPLQVYDSYSWYYQNQTYSSAIAARTATSYNGTDASINMNVVSFSTQPSLIALAVRPLTSGATSLTGGNQPKSYLPITGCNLNYVNGSVLNVPQGQDYTLYEMSLRNGLNMDYNQWSGASQSYTLSNPAAASVSSIQSLGGGFILINPQLDLQSAKDPETCAGTAAQLSSGYNLSGTIYIRNQRSDALGASVAMAYGVVTTYELVVLALYPQQLKEVSLGSYIQTNYIVDMDNIEDVKDPQLTMHAIYNDTDLVGGGFLSFFRNIGDKVKHGFDKVKHGVEKGYDAVKGVAEKVISAAKHLPWNDVKNALEKYGPGILKKVGNSMIAEIPGIGPVLAQAAQVAEKYGPKVIAGIERVQGAVDKAHSMMGHGYDMDPMKMSARELGFNDDVFDMVRPHIQYIGGSYDSMVDNRSARSKLLSRAY